MITDRDRKWLSEIIAIAKPAHSLAAKLERLSNEQRDYFEGWKAHYDRWMQRNDDDNGHAYEIALQGYGPTLRCDISVALFGKTPRILKTDSENDASQKWAEDCQ